LNRPLFHNAMKLGRAVRPLMPKALQAKVQPMRDTGLWPTTAHNRTVLLLDSCVQNSMAPSIDYAAARVLDRAGVTLKHIPAGGCCGAVSHHMNAHDEAVEIVKRNIDAWWPQIEAGAEAVVATASGCSVMLKDYGHFMQNEVAYAEKAKKIAALSKDISEVIANEWPLLKDKVKLSDKTIAYHPPCTLQHGMKLKGGVEQLLRDMGFTLAPVADSHLCCGSAGTYSVLQPTISEELKSRKIKSLTANAPSEIATANIGCMTHLQSGTTLVVKHWIELLDERLRV
jgi:glycolate oxidase iron-sulfur subunit